MTFGIRPKTNLVDGAGNVRLGATVEVRRMAPGFPLVVPLYARPDGAPTTEWPTGLMDNPFVSADGEVQYCVGVGGYFRETYNLPGAVEPQIEDWVAIGTAQAADVDAYATAGFTWAPESATSAPPTAGCIRASNADWTLATHLYIRKTTLGGSDVATWLLNFGAGDDLFLSTGVGVELSWTVVSVTDQTNHVDIEVGSYNGPAGPLSLGDSGFVTIAKGVAGQDGAPGGPVIVSSIAALKTLNTGVVTTAYLTAIGKEGTFLWLAGNYSSQVTADASEGIYVKANAVASSSGAWVRVYTGPVRAEWFGAVRGSVSPGQRTTNTTAINAAITVGLNVGLLPGLYETDGTVTLGAASTSLRGAGVNITTLKTFATSTAAIERTNVGDVIISDLTVDRGATAINGGWGIDCNTPAQNTLIENVIVQNHFRGIRLGTTDRSTLRNAFVTKNLDDGIILRNDVGYGPVQWDFYFVYATQNVGWGIRALSLAGPGAMILGSWVDVTTYANTVGGIGLFGNATTPIADVRLTKAFVGSDGHYGIYVDYAVYVLIHSVIVELIGEVATGPTGATAAARDGIGIYTTANVEDIQVTAALVMACSDIGMFNDADYLTLSSVEFQNNGAYASAGNRHGLYINTSTTRAILTGVRSRNRSTTNQQYGVVSTVDAVTITGCDFTGNNAGALFGALTPANSNVKGNLPTSINMPEEEISILTADRSGADVNTVQAVFGSSEDAITLKGSTTYEFEAEYVITRAAGTTSHTTAVLFGGTATFTSIDYAARVSNPTGNVLSAVSEIVGNAATALTLTAANTSATENIRVRLRGTMRINAAGTVIPQFKFSAAPGGAPSIKRNSFFRAWPIGSDSVAKVGNWG